MVTRNAISVAALVRDDRVLLVHRHPERRHYPNCWDLVGGHIELGESPREAAIRECVEEIGVHIYDPIAIPMEIADNTLDMHGFLVTRWDGEPVNASPEEHDDLRWFRSNDLAYVTMAHPTNVENIRSAMQFAQQIGSGREPS